MVSANKNLVFLELSNVRSHPHSFCFVFCPHFQHLPLPPNVSSKSTHRSFLGSGSCSRREHKLRWLHLGIFMYALSLWQRSASAEDTLTLLKVWILLRWPKGLVGLFSGTAPISSTSAPYFPEPLVLHITVLPLLNCLVKGTESRRKLEWIKNTWIYIYIGDKYKYTYTYHFSRVVWELWSCI